MKAAILKTFISASPLAFQTKNNEVWAEPTPAPLSATPDSPAVFSKDHEHVYSSRSHSERELRILRAVKKIKNYREWHHDRDIWRASIQEGTCLHQRQTHGAPCRSMPTLQHPRDARTRSWHGVIAQHPRQRQGWSPPCSCQPGPGFQSAPTHP